MRVDWDRVSVRPAGRLSVDMRGKSVDDDFFTKPSCNMYYILGFIFADGSIFSRYGSCKYLSIASIDYDLLCELVAEMKSTYAISKVSKGLETQSDLYITQINSEKICSDLKMLGVIERKGSKDYPYPEIPSEYSSSFIRGVFDGDGSVSLLPRYVKGRVKVQLLGAVTFLSGMSDVLLFNGMNFYQYCGTLSTGAWSTALKFYKYIYSDIGIRLERKYVKFTNILESYYGSLSRDLQG